MHYDVFTLLVTELVEADDTLELKVQATEAAGLPIIIEPVRSSCALASVRALAAACPAQPIEIAKQLEAGAALGNALLPGLIGQRFGQALALARSRSHGLRIRIVGSDRTHGLPWEYAVLPAENGETSESDFLAMMPDVSMVRDQSISLRPWPRTTLPFRIAATAAHPSCTAPLEVGRERALLHEALRDLTSVELSWSANGARPSMTEKAEMFHFAGHGALVAAGPGAPRARDVMAPVAPDTPGTARPGDGAGHLVFEGANGRADYVSAGHLGVILREMGVRVAVLNACKTASRDGARSWTSIAAALLKAGVRSVVAMQHSVLDDSAIAFAAAFYRSLAIGGSLDEAMRNGRVAVFDRGDEYGWGTPVLYSCATDALVFPEARTVAANRSALHELDQHVQQTYRSRVLRCAEPQTHVAAAARKQISLRVIAGPDMGRAFSLQHRDRFVAGRAPTAHFQVTQDGYFSRHHLLIEAGAPDLTLQDLRSTNGTFVNNERATRPRTLHHGDIVSSGKTRIRIEISTSADLRHSLSRTTIAVRCGRCGSQARDEQPRLFEEEVAYVCEPCRTVLLATPDAPTGYRIIKRLGGGPNGVVYLGVHPERGRHALKVIIPRVAMSRELGRAFVREVSSGTRLSHPNIARIFDCIEQSPGRFCATMEHVDGHSALDLIRQRPHGMDPRDAIEIIAKVLDGLAYAHDQAIVHRDIKDSNVLVARGPRDELVVKVSDFALARSCEALGINGAVIANTEPRLASQLAPERILCFAGVTPLADLYSAAALLYQLLTGQPAFEFHPHRDPLVTILEDEIVPVSWRRPSVRPSVAAVIERAMRREPAERFRSASEMRHALVTASAG